MYLHFIEWAKILVILDKIIFVLEFIRIKEMKQSPKIQKKKEIEEMNVL